MSEPRVVRTWDELPPVVEAEGEVFSTRVLEHRYRALEASHRRLVDAVSVISRYEMMKPREYDEFKAALAEAETLIK